MKSKTFKKTRLATSLSLVLGVGVVMPAFADDAQEQNAKAEEKLK